MPLCGIIINCADHAFHSTILTTSIFFSSVDYLTYKLSVYLYEYSNNNKPLEK